MRKFTDGRPKGKVKTQYEEWFEELKRIKRENQAKKFKAKARDYLINAGDGYVLFDNGDCILYKDLPPRLKLYMKRKRRKEKGLDPGKNIYPSHRTGLNSPPVPTESTLFHHKWKKPYWKFHKEGTKWVKTKKKVVINEPE
jgi:hypothetical protein